MILKEIIGKILAGERDGTTLWKIGINEIEYSPMIDPAEGVSIASLAENILHCGQLQPILLYRQKQFAAGQPYRLIAGRRRLEAMRMLGYTHVNAIVVRCDERQVEVLAMSDNALHREANVWELAHRARKLLLDGMSVERLTALLAMSEDRLHKILKLTEIPENEARLMKLAKASPEDVDALLQMSPDVRLAILNEACTSIGENVSTLIRRWQNDTKESSLIPHKICVGDVRFFLNTLERAADTMRCAGFDVFVRSTECSDCYDISIQVAKRAGVLLKPSVHNVSRETLPQTASRPRLSMALSIFEAIAEDECAFAEDVSRETSDVVRDIFQENAENLELCIDGQIKK